MISKLFAIITSLKAFFDSFKKGFLVLIKRKSKRKIEDAFENNDNDSLNDTFK